MMHQTLNTIVNPTKSPSIKSRKLFNGKNFSINIAIPINRVPIGNTKFCLFFIFRLSFYPKSVLLTQKLSIITFSILTIYNIFPSEKYVINQLNLHHISI